MFLERLPKEWLALHEHTSGKTQSRGVFFHALLESWKGGFLDRLRYFGDPTYVMMPLQAILAPERSRRRTDVFRLDVARQTRAYELPLMQEEKSMHKDHKGGTSHACVVDAEGNVASVTTTINLLFGAGYTAAGVFMNNEMDDFSSQSSNGKNAFSLIGSTYNLPAPWKRPVSSMSPTIVLDDQGPILCIGGAGGSRIPTAVEQVTLFQLALNMSPSESLKASRVHHQGFPDETLYETWAPLPERVRKELLRRRHHIKPTSHIANVQLIRIIKGKHPHIVAASDPRKGGIPAGY